ncbi:methyltransferase MtaA/CmuA family [Pelomyxa schiedti]|nr:methyltransferase MtaA/CmuA family [Pelomyxa schiedti]
MGMRPGALPDRVPVMCQLTMGHYFLHSGVAPHKVFFTSEGFAEALVAMQRRYRFDGILINIPGRPEEAVARHMVNVKVDDGREHVLWDNGFTTIFPPDDSPILVPSGGNEVSVHCETFSPFTHFVELLGYERALEALATDPDNCVSLIDALVKPSSALGVALACAGADAVLISSAFSGGPFLSSRMYRKFVLPFERKVVENIVTAAPNVKVYTHACGKIGDRLELMAQTGTHGIDTLDPPPLGNTELSVAKEQVGRQLFLKGNMNSVEMLSFTTPQQVEQHAVDRIRTGMPGGGYILSTACSVAPRVAPWILEMLTPLAEREGVYTS